MSLQTIDLALQIPFPPILPPLQGGQTFIVSAQEPQNKPTVVWCQNVLPTVDGVASVIYSTYVDDTETLAGDQADLIRVQTIWDFDGDLATLYFYADGSHVVLNPTSKEWEIQQTGGETGRPSNHVYVRGRSYVFDGVKAYKFDAGFADMTEEVLDGITTGDMLGFTSALDYAIAWDADTIYWSVPGSPGNWNPLSGAVLTGAGSTKVVELVGQIKTCHRISGGFIIYGSINMVSARYSGNSRNPWIFKGLDGSAGIIRLDGVSSSDSSANHFVHTNEGVKEVTLAKCENVFPEVGKMLASMTYYTSDGDGTFTKVVSNPGGDLAHLVVKCTYVGDRYFCLSFGIAGATSFALALVFDTGLQQWGVLKTDHVDIFELIDVYTIDGTGDGDQGWGLLGVLNPSGRVYSAKEVTTSTQMPADLAATSEIVFGQLRVTKNRSSSINKISATGYIDTSSDANYDVKVMSFPETDVGVAEVDFDNYPTGSTHFLGESAGLYHQLRIAGNFNLTSLSIDINTAGKL